MKRALEPNISRPMPERAESLVPGDPIAATDLPSASPETTELSGTLAEETPPAESYLLDRVGTLVFGYSALVEILLEFQNPQSLDQWKRRLRSSRPVDSFGDHGLCSGLDLHRRSKRS